MASATSTEDPIAQAPIVVVSGLPRSGTSLMMRMLETAAFEPLVDANRPADLDNPRGYYEYAPVKGTARDASWVPGARGRCVKVVSELLPSLPSTECYVVIFMRRRLEEVLASQRTMLERQGTPASPDNDAELRRLLLSHLEDTQAHLRTEGHFEVRYQNYNRLLADPASQCEALAAFLTPSATRLGLPAPDPAALAAVVEPALYRQRG